MIDRDTVMDVLLGLFGAAYLIGIPIAFGYLITDLGSKEPLLTFWGAVIWPLVLLARVGSWMAGG